MQCNGAVEPPFVEGLRSALFGEPLMKLVDNAAELLFAAHERRIP